MNTAALIDWFEDNFLCIVGLPRVWMEIPTGPDQYVRWVYEVYQVRTREPNGAEERLAAALQGIFLPLVGTDAHKTLLLWRLPSKIAFSAVHLPQYGETVALPGHAEDGLMGWELRTRLVIPAVLWLPEGTKTPVPAKAGVPAQYIP